MTAPASGSDPSGTSWGTVVLGALLVVLGGHLLLVPVYRAVRDRCRLDRAQLAAGGRGPTRALVPGGISPAAGWARGLLAAALIAAGLVVGRGLLPLVLGVALVGLAPVLAAVTAGWRTERLLRDRLIALAQAETAARSAGSARREHLVREEADALRRACATSTPGRPRDVLTTLYALESDRDTLVPLTELADETGAAPEAVLLALTGLHRAGLVERTDPDPDTGWRNSWFRTTERGGREAMTDNQPRIEFHGTVNAGAIGHGNTVSVGNVGSHGRVDHLYDALAAEVATVSAATDDDEVRDALATEIDALHDGTQRDNAVTRVLAMARRLGDAGRPVVALALQIRELTR